jgi:hypothetical protein
VILSWERARVRVKSPYQLLDVSLSLHCVGVPDIHYLRLTDVSSLSFLMGPDGSGGDAGYGFRSSER